MEPPTAVRAPCEAATQPPSILSSSTAIVYHVLRNLGAPCELARAAAVSRLWRDVASVPSLWTALLEQEHSAASVPPPPVPIVAQRPDTRPDCAVVQQQRHQQPTPLLPRALLQPPSDELDTPAAQLGRWLGMRRLVCGAAQLPGVRGAWAAYSASTARLVVLDQEKQLVAFVDLEAGADGGGGDGGAGSGCDRGGSGNGADRGGSGSGADRGGSGSGVDRGGSGSGGCAQRRLMRSPVGPMAAEAEAETPSKAMAAAAVHVLRVPDPEPEPRLGGDGGAAEAAVGAELGVAAAAQAPPPAGPAAEEQLQQGFEEGGDELRPEERHTLQVVTCCGDGLVATGHPDGRVLVWDSANAALSYVLPRVEGCGRGPALALAADGGLLAVAYRREVLVWELPAGRRQAAGRRASDAGRGGRNGGDAVSARRGDCGGGGLHGRDDGGGTRWSLPSLAALIKPTLEMAVRSLALSGRHGVLAMRSWDGVELREARGGRWLYSLPDRRNTSLLAAGDVLFVASSSPSFLGNTFLQFEIEVAAIDLGAVLAAAAGADCWDDGGANGGSGAAANGGVRGGAAPGDAPGPAAAAAATATGGGAPGGGVVHGGAARTPLVVRTVSTPLHYTLRGPPLSEFKWDRPLQMCLTEGMLLLRCLQFPLAPGQLAWPGMFAFRLGDLVSGLALGGRRSGRDGGGVEGVGGDGGDGAGGAAALPPMVEEVAAAAAAAGDVTPEEHVPPPAPPPQELPGPVVAGSAAAAVVAPGLEQGPAAAGGVRISAIGGTAAAAATPIPLAPIVLCRTIQPEVLCGDGGFVTKWRAGGPAIGSGLARGSMTVSSTSPMQCSAASLQLLAARRHLVIMSEAHEVWVMGVPYSGPRRM